MKLPEGARYHFQMQYGSIGWATGATLGVAVGVGMHFIVYVHVCVHGWCACVCVLMCIFSR